ncbi:chorismate mutase 2 [Rosa sericea]
MGGLGLVHLLLVLVLTSGSCSCSRRILNMAEAPNPNSASKNESLTLEKVRQALISQEDTIVFRLIERAAFPLNSPTYHHQISSSPSLFNFIVKSTEALQSQAGRYEIPEELPFFPENLPPSLLPPPADPPVLHPAAASINLNKKILDIYLKQLLPLFAVPGDDGNYAATASSDLDCLQAISRRIHYGYYVAEVKFRDAPQDYEPAIRAQDREGLMKLLTFTNVEEQVKKRVEKKAVIFGQEVSLDNNTNSVKQNGTVNGKYKVDPSLVSRLYGEWVMPLTKDVQVEYLLRRLD